ncbi:MAG: NADPH:quinone reductase [Phenylobacterium sp.]|nr:NADPH:quinone reductase [Phenylobacterium sp.]
MTKTVLVTEYGPPEVMKLVDVDLGKPGPGEVRIRHTAIGVNFGDIHYRRGTAPPHSMAKLPHPFTPGLEGVGVIEETGLGVQQFKPGDRVGYASASFTVGAYAEARLFPADRVFKLPSGVTDVQSAALLYQAITVQGMLRQCYPVKAGDVILLHAAAGGIGSILSRWASHVGATVIGTVSAESKVDKARSNGCAHVIVHAQEDFVARTQDITNNRGVDVVFDGVGADFFLRSLGALKKYGMLVSFGQAAGLPPPFDPVELQHRGHYLTKFSGGTYNEDAGEYQARAREVLAAMLDGVFDLDNHSEYALADVARAHDDLENRRTVGSLVLIP